MQTALAPLTLRPEPAEALLQSSDLGQHNTTQHKTRHANLPRAGAMFWLLWSPRTGDRRQRHTHTSPFHKATVRQRTLVRCFRKISPSRGWQWAHSVFSSPVMGVLHAMHLKVFTEKRMMPVDVEGVGFCTAPPHPPTPHTHAWRPPQPRRGEVNARVKVTRGRVRRSRENETRWDHWRCWAGGRERGGGVEGPGPAHVRTHCGYAPRAAGSLGDP